jgi:7,8-dihydroneopterin aldolase/epimerase/oxygenase
MSKINIHQIRVRANHGCWEEEEIIGGDYIVDVSLDVDFKAAADRDDLSLTADYVAIKEIVYREMAVRSKLIETVAHRILDSIKKDVPLVELAHVKVTKLNAPMGGQVESVSVEVIG